MLDCKRDRFTKSRELRGIVKNVRLTRLTRGSCGANTDAQRNRLKNNNTIVPLIDIEEVTPPGRARSRQSAGGSRCMYADPSAIAKGDLIKCLLLRDLVIATYLFSVEVNQRERYARHGSLKCGIKKTVWSNRTSGSHFHADIIFSRGRVVSVRICETRWKYARVRENNNVTTNSPAAERL